MDANDPKSDPASFSGNPTAPAKVEAPKGFRPFGSSAPETSAGTGALPPSTSSAGGAASPSPSVPPASFSPYSVVDGGDGQRYAFRDDDKTGEAVRVFSVSSPKEDTDKILQASGATYNPQLKLYTNVPEDTIKALGQGRLTSAAYWDMLWKGSEADSVRAINGLQLVDGEKPLEQTLADNHLATIQAQLAERPDMAWTGKGGIVADMIHNPPEAALHFAEKAATYIPQVLDVLGESVKYGLGSAAAVGLASGGSLALPAGLVGAGYGTYKAVRDLSTGKLASDWAERGVPLDQIKKWAPIAGNVDGFLMSIGFMSMSALAKGAVIDKLAASAVAKRALAHLAVEYAIEGGVSTGGVMAAQAMVHDYLHNVAAELTHRPELLESPKDILVDMAEAGLGGLILGGVLGLVSGAIAEFHKLLAQEQGSPEGKKVLASLKRAENPNVEDAVKRRLMPPTGAELEPQTPAGEAGPAGGQSPAPKPSGAPEQTPSASPQPSEGSAPPALPPKEPSTSSSPSSASSIAPVGAFRKLDVNAEPSVAPGMSRLYRGEFQGRVEEESLLPEFRGRWATTNKTYALMMGGPEHVSYTDVPTKNLKDYAVKNFPTAHENAVSRGGSVLAEQEYILPSTSSSFSPKESVPGVEEQVKSEMKEAIPEAVDDIAATDEPVKNFLGVSEKDVVFSGDIEADRYALENANEVDRIHAFQLLGGAKGSPADYEAIYHYAEDPEANPLTPEQMRIYESEIKPLQEASRKAYYELKKQEVPVGPDEYSSRLVAGRGGVVEKLKAGFQSVVDTVLLRKSTGSLKHRIMWALENEAGTERKIVSIKGGEVTEWLDKKPIPMGARKLPVKRLGGQKVGGIIPPEQFMDATGKTWNVVQATTKEIEKNSDVTYHKNALVTSLLNYLNLRKVQRTIAFLEELKSTREFNDLAVKVNTPKYDRLLAEDPKGYRETELPQFRGYVFPTRVAEILNDFHRKAAVDGVAVAYGKINQVMRNAIFFNPLIHIPNIGNHWLVDRGVTPWQKPGDYSTLGATSVKAWKAVTTMNEDYVAALDAGAHLLFAKTKMESMAQMFLEKAGVELAADKTLAGHIGAELGVLNPVTWVKSVYKFSSKVTWAANDIATLQRIYERMESGGLSLEQAVEETAKHIPNYRIPARVLNSRTIASILKGDSGLTMFGAYHYGALKSYGEMIGNLVDAMRGKAAPGVVAETLDKIAALAVATYVIYPMLDKAAQTVTGNPNASVRRAGASTILANAQKLIEKATADSEYTKTGKLKNGVTSVDIARFVQSIVTPSVGLKVGMEFYFGRDTFNGRPISYGQKAMGALSPIDYARQMYDGSMGFGQFVAGLIGVKLPEEKGGKHRKIGLGGYPE